MTDVVMNWCGPELLPKSIEAEARELGNFAVQFADALERLRSNECLRLDLSRPIEDLEEALARAAPVFRLVASQPRRQTVAHAAEYWELLSRLALAEVAFIAAFARARARLLYRASTVAPGRD